MMRRRPSGLLSGVWMRYAFRRLGFFLFLTGLPAVVLGQSESLERRAHTLLSAKCFACHGEAKMSGLDLREQATALQGGKRGPAIVPGNAEGSLLYHAIRREGDLEMPPGDAALSAAEVVLLRDWINAGARWEMGGASSQVASSWWSFEMPVRPPVPSDAKSPIDAFILSKLDERGLKQAPPADRRTLARRAYIDLHGLPPTPEEVQAFVDDQSPDAYKDLIDKLLDSPRYGERWGRYWLDLVRYADTSGFETDHFFTTAWRYRDWVIESFNQDKPYDTFIQEQIAADEIWSTDMDLEGTDDLPKEKEENVHRRIGTSLFTLGSFPIEYTFYGDQFRAEWQADAVDTVGAAFLGLTVGCARCHDHKFDPISQRDYYRMTALFAGSVEREIPLVSLFDVQSNTRNFPLLEQANILKRMVRSAGRSREGSDQAQMSEEDRDELLRRLGEAFLQAPEPYSSAKVLGHEEIVRDTHILVRGDFKNRGEKVDPGFITALNPGPPIKEPEGGVLFVPQRRKALAQWLTAPDQPLVARVMVNRIWQGHFGFGLVRTPNDFGRQGDAPTHPKLLDWLAVEFAEKGWSIKQLHRLIMLSDTYQASSVGDAQSIERDPDNYYLSRMNRRRMDADVLRDSMLAVSGNLNLKMGGVGVILPLTEEEILAARMPRLWPANPDPAEHVRRSVYLQMKRSLTVPMLQIFDAPDTATSCPRRETSTVAPQALALMNSNFSTTQAAEFAKRIRQTATDDGNSVETAWLLALGRSPSDSERATAMDYLSRNSLERLCLLIFNMNEFVYVD